MTSHADIAERFSKGAISGKASSMFIDGDTIYSYGYHFPIARHTKLLFKAQQVVLFNSRGYSSSTARHKMRTAQALRSFFLLEVFGADEKNVNDQFNQNNHDIQEAIGKMQRARTNNSKIWYASQIRHKEEQNAALLKLYGVRE
jgi:hypothetical protein